MSTDRSRVSTYDVFMPDPDVDMPAAPPPRRPPPGPPPQGPSSEVPVPADAPVAPARARPSLARIHLLDIHPPFRDLLQHKAFTVKWMLENLTNAATAVAMSGIDISAEIYRPFCCRET